MTRRSKTAINLCLLVTIFASLNLSLPQQPSWAQLSSSSYEVEVVTNIVYYNGPDFNPKKHLLDIYEPKGLSSAPVLMFVHGGGWQSGDKSLYSYLGRTFASQGFTTVVISYRLTPEVQHPGHIQDVARAFAWIYRNIAQHNGNPERVFVAGHSAGGHLTALLALDERYLNAEGLSTNRIRGAMPISGVYDLNTIPGFDSVFTSDPETRREASPVAHVDEHQPPFLITYAQFDYPTADIQSAELLNLLRQENSEAQTLTIPAKDHITIITSIGRPGDLTTESMLDFMRAHLDS